MSFLQHLRAQEDWEIRQWKAFRSHEAQRLLAELPAARTRSITSLGAASAAPALEILGKNAGFHVASSSALPAPLADTVKVAAVDEALRISLPDVSQDLLLCLYAMEFLPMDRLYMACSEAKRLLPEGGRWVMLSHHPGRSFYERCRAKLRGSGFRTLDLNHYVSPEDWDTLREGFFHREGVTSQFLVLQRKSG